MPPSGLWTGKLGAPLSLVLWPVPLNIPLLSPPDMLPSTPKALSSLQSLLRVSTAAPVLCLYVAPTRLPQIKSLHLGPLFWVSRDLQNLGLSSSYVTSSDWDVVDALRLNGGRQRSSFQDWVAFWGPKLLCSPHCPSRAQAYIMRPGMVFPWSELAQRRICGWAGFDNNNNDCTDIVSHSMRMCGADCLISSFHCIILFTQGPIQTPSSPGGPFWHTSRNSHLFWASRAPAPPSGLLKCPPLVVCFLHQIRHAQAPSRQNCRSSHSTTVVRKGY